MSDVSDEQRQEAFDAFLDCALGVVMIVLGAFAFGALAALAGWYLFA